MAEVSERTYFGPGLPAPFIGDLDRPYWEGAIAHRLMVQVCNSCAAVQWPPEEICSACHSTDRAWKESPGAGRIHSWTRVWHPVHPALVGECPYLVVVVRLDDCPVFMVGNLVGPPGQSVDAGMAVSVEFEDHIPDGYTLVQWRRVE